MLKFPPLFVQKIFCFVQIPKVFVQKHETKTAETEGNGNNIRRKQQQCPEKTTAASKENNNSVRKTTAKSEKSMSKSLTDFIQKFLSFVQIPKSFVQKHETITAETGENDGSIRRELQQHARKTTAVSGKNNDSNIQEKHTQKSYGFCTKVFEFCAKTIFFVQNKTKTAGENPKGKRIFS